MSLKEEVEETRRKNAFVKCIVDAYMLSFCSNDCMQFNFDEMDGWVYDLFFQRYAWKRKEP